MIEFQISSKRKLNFEKDCMYLLSSLCLLIEHFATPKKPEVLLPKLLIIYWAAKTKGNLERFLASKANGFEYLPQYQVSSELGNTAIYAILNGFVTQIVKSESVYLTLTPKGLGLLKTIHNENLFQDFRSRLEKIGKIPNSVTTKEVGLL